MCSAPVQGRAGGVHFAQWAGEGQAGWLELCRALPTSERTTLPGAGARRGAGAGARRGAGAGADRRGAAQTQQR